MDKQGLLFDDMDDLTEAQQVYAKIGMNFQIQ